MAGRRLDPEESEIWRKVTASVRPLKRAVAPVQPTTSPNRAHVEPADRSSATFEPGFNKLSLRADFAIGERAKAVPRTAIVRAISKPADTLDGGWDRRLRRGVISPERSIDLHGHTLAHAHVALEAAIASAVADDVRILLVVTGRPPREDDDPDRPRRGGIRRAIGDWLAGSRHANRIAAVRNAHPRHGGAGALYLILRRRREAT